MRFLVLSMGTMVLVAGAVWAQTPSGGAMVPQIPYGQTFKDFQFPYYENGLLRAKVSVASAKGVTLNRAEATEVKIDLYDQDKVTTTITSPKADLYVAELRMRTKNTVLIERADMEATAQTCDFDNKNKSYLLRENVRVVLKNFNTGLTHPAGGTTAAPMPATDNSPASPSPRPAASISPRNDSLMDIPGAYANTNVAPTPSPSSTVTP